MTPTPAADPLYEILSRIGIKHNASEFTQAVAESFRTVEPVPEAVVQDRFRKSRAYRDFRGMLRRAALAPDARVLAIGCGRGLAGRSAEYAATVTREVYPEAVVEQMDYTAGIEETAGAPYDVVVTHSLLHFVFDYSPLCDLIHRTLSAAGCYVMANEPNVRFWRNAECVAELERVSRAEGRRRRLLKFTAPSRYWARLMRAMRPNAGGDMTAGVNRMLRERLGMRGELAANEILRIVDPHVRDEFAGGRRLGSDGLDFDALARGPLCRFELESVRTSGYVMRDNPARVLERWRELNDELTKRFPLDGCSFTALWRRRR
jgi:hypothetical protein